jgi:hypothetical protein
MWSKYFPNLSFIEWFRLPNKSSTGSIVWKDLVEAFPLVGEWVVWKIGDRKKGSGWERTPGWEQEIPLDFLYLSSFP